MKITEPIRLDPPGLVDVMIKTEKGPPQASRFKVDLIGLPDTDRNDDFFWAELEGVMRIVERQEDVLGWEIHR